MKSIEFLKFIDLVTFDQSLVALEHDIKKAFAAQESIIAQIERLQDQDEDLKYAIHQARKAVDDKELSMKILDQKETQLKDKIAAVTNQKEYKSLEKETAALNAQRIVAEQELVNLWNKLETYKKNYEFNHQLQQEQIEQFQCQVRLVEEQIVQLRMQQAELHASRQDKEIGVPQDWLAMYINMKGRVPNPVVPVVNDACDACFYSATPKDLQALRQNKLLQCKDCYRLLYIA